MSQENVEIAKALGSAMRDGQDWSRFVTLDYVWDMSTAPGMWPEAQHYQGVDAVQRFVTEWTETFDEWTHSIEEEIDRGEQVILVTHERGRIKGTDTELDGRWAYLSTFRDGKITKTEVFFTKEEALEAAGLSESTMSQENVELARAALNWFAQLDEGLVGPEGWGEFFAQDTLVTFSGFGFMDDQTFRGFGFFEFRSSWMEPYDEWEYEPREILDAGGSQVVVLLHQRGRPHGSDSWVEMDYGMVYTVERGLISRTTFYAAPERALEAAGLRE